jgi:hypothetical protein
MRTLTCSTCMLTVGSSALRLGTLILGTDNKSSSISAFFWLVAPNRSHVFEAAKRADATHDVKKVLVSAAGPCKGPAHVHRALPRDEASERACEQQRCRTSKVMRGEMMKGPSVTHSSNMRL